MAELKLQALPASSRRPMPGALHPYLSAQSAKAKELPQPLPQSEDRDHYP